jgi:Domain of unknown function (DUF4394)
MRLGGLVLVAATLALASATPASAEPAVGLVGSSIATFDTATPGQVSVKAISGLQAASTEKVLGIDWRPRTGQVGIVTVPVGVAANALVRTYMLDPSTGAATFVGSIPNTVPGAADVPTGMDFNPTVDRIRMAMSNDENYRINPNNGSLAGNDPNLNPAGNQIVAAAYDRNFDRMIATPPTTLYEISRAANSLMVQGGIDGAGPGGANGGTLTTIGPLGVTLLGTSDAGLDISPNTGTAFASLHPAGPSLPRLYTVNLTTGAATEVGAFPLDIADLTILPTPPPAPPSGGETTTVTNTVTNTVTTPPFRPDRPTGLIDLAKVPKLKSALKRLAFSFSCDEACTAVGRLLAGRKVLAEGTATLATAGVGRITLTPTKDGKKTAKSRRKRLATTLQLTFTDDVGASSTLTRRLTLKR